MTPAPAVLADRLYRQRRARDDAFGADRDGFGEPAWDMLLWILAQGEAARPSIAATIAAAAVPEDIAQPYVSWLSSRHLVELEGGNIALTARGVAIMISYVEGELH